MVKKILGNRYELLEKIGGGGMAVVYKAKCHLLNRYVAVKILRDEFINDEEFVKRFRIEAQAAASLSHPNIVSIFDVGQEENVHYIVMEYIDGITLKDYITQKGSLNWKEAAGIAIQICSAIEQAHKNHVIHRDIKPHNILITKEGIAKVTDFGIARAVSSSTITMVGSTIGSVHYFSPEQARGGFTDEKSDLYSLGITIYEMITGKVPFDGESPVAVALKHIQNKAERPVDINPRIPATMNDIVMKAIKKDQNLRYQTASELLSDLHRAVSDPNFVFSEDDLNINEFPTKKLHALDDVEYANDGDDYIEEPKKPKDRKDKLSIWLGIITGIIIISIFSYVGYKIVIPAILPEKVEFTVTDYVGKDFGMIQDELKKNNIEAVEDKTVFSDTVEKGIIISQDIAPDMTLKPGSVIKFEVSDGPEMVTIPDVSMKESRLAEQNLRDFKLETTVKTEYSDSVATGLIIRTEPGASEQVKPGTLVTLIESLGPELKQVEVPSFIGMTRAEAEKLILDSKLTIGKITPPDVVSDTALIIKQYPLAKAMADEGTPVDLTYETDSATQTGEGSDSTSNTHEVGSQYKEWKIPLNNPDKYNDDDDILIYVEATLSDTNESIVIMDKVVHKGDFPMSVNIPVSSTGTTHVVVKLDNVVVTDSDI